MNSRADHRQLCRSQALPRDALRQPGEDPQGIQPGNRPGRRRADRSGNGARILEPLQGQLVVAHEVLALNGLFCFAIRRGVLSASPMPYLIPKRPAYATPYIYSPEELRRLLEATAALDVHYPKNGQRRASNRRRSARSSCCCTAPACG